MYRWQPPRSVLRLTPHRGRRVQAPGDSSRRMPPRPPPANNAGSDRSRSCPSTYATPASSVHPASPRLDRNGLRWPATAANDRSWRADEIRHQPPGYRAQRAPHGKLLVRQHVADKAFANATAGLTLLVTLRTRGCGRAADCAAATPSGEAAAIMAANLSKFRLPGTSVVATEGNIVRSVQWRPHLQHGLQSSVRGTSRNFQCDARCRCVCPRNRSPHHIPSPPIASSRPATLPRWRVASICQL